MDFGLIGIGAVLAFAAIGSALGSGTAGMAAIGAWKKCYAQNRPAPFMLIAFVVLMLDVSFTVIFLVVLIPIVLRTPIRRLIGRYMEKQFLELFVAMGDVPEE